MTDRPTAVPVRPGERSTTAFRVTFALGLFIAVAIVKPWGEPTPRTSGDSGVLPGPTSGSSGGGIAGLPEPSVEAAEAATSCLSSDSEQLVVVERWPGNEIRSWIAVDDVAASGPLDPAMTSTDVFAAHAIGIGVCAPTDEATRSAVPGESARGGGHAAVIVDVQSISNPAASAAPVDLGAPVELPLLGTGPDAVRLYRLLVPASADGGAAASADGGAAGSADGGAAASATRAGSATSSTSPTSPATGLPSDAPGQRSWSLGAYAIAFQFPFDLPGTRHWLRFALVRGGGGG